MAELVLTTNVLMLRDRRFVQLVAATAGALGLTTVLVLVAIWGEHGSALARAIGALAILTALGYFLTPVLQRFAAEPNAARPDVTVLGVMNEVELVASRGAVDGVEVDASPAAGEHLYLRRA